MEVANPSSASHAWWLPVKHSPLIVSPRIESLAGAKVCTFTDPNHEYWNNEVIDSTMLNFEAEIIKKIPLCDIDQLDTLTWPYNPKGEYTVKSGYQFLQMVYRNLQLGQSDSSWLKPLWQAIWGLPIPSKVRNLVWRAAKNSLPTKKNLVRRQIIKEDYCDLCREHQEDVKHDLYSFPKLDEPWNKTPLWNHTNLKQVISFIELLKTVFAENRELALFSIVMWALWTH
ncbi:uncharacterized protein LOC111997138 [Quercus suber]|uniref:uncharacterized protein LOC111997138 n=1 Tax=Quercus suber TaxID=58331 RepID=UPI0032DF1A7D